MKFRKGFVTNSSSSSFICDVCGNSEAGYDLSLEDAGMYHCVNGHYFCENHALEAKEPTNETDNDEEDDYKDDDRYETPISRCPICQFKAVKVDDAYKFLLKTIPLTEERVLEAMRTHCTGNYKQLQKILKRK